jgi:hypothetical protein
MSKKQRLGIIVSAKSDKTLIVATQIKYQHKKYIKILVKTKRFMAHDAENIGNFRQMDHIFTYPWGGAIDASYSWGPSNGRMIYAGVRFELR